MLTVLVKYCDPNLYERECIYEAESIEVEEFGPHAGLKINHSNDNFTFLTARAENDENPQHLKTVYVMNSNGATVGRYNI